MKNIHTDCELCGVEIKERYGSGRFCSAFCARKFSTHIRRQEINNKVSRKIKNKISKEGTLGFIKPKNEVVDKICPMCGTKFESWKCHERIFCSRKCMNSDVKFLYKKKPKGGYRKNSGRSKSGYFKGIWCQSSYELAYVIYNFDHGIDFTRNTKRYSYVFEDNKHEYLPDFLEGDTIVEMKGYKDKRVDAKSASVSGKYKILYKKDLKYAFDYILKKYGKKPENVVEMYDQYKPTYNYLCGVCGKEFGVERKRRTNNVYCSKSCAGKSVGGTH